MERKSLRKLKQLYEEAIVALDKLEGEVHAEEKRREEAPKTEPRREGKPPITLHLGEGRNDRFGPFSVN